jgi:hypothetical protein
MADEQADATGNRTVTERLIDLFQKRSPVALIYLIATSISAVAIIGATVVSVDHWYNNHFNWQAAAEEKLSELQAGYSLPYFVQQLGTPIISRSVDKGYTEDVFKGRGFLIETLTKGNGEVYYYQATVCDPSVRPTFPVGAGSSVTLNSSTFASVANDPQYEYNTGTFGLSGAPFMREYLYLGLQGTYRTFLWGINVGCPGGANEVEALTAGLSFPAQKAPSRSRLSWIRNHAIPNTYGVTAPTTSVSDLPSQFSLDLISILLGEDQGNVPGSAGQRRLGTPSPCAGQPGDLVSRAAPCWQY